MNDSDLAFFRNLTARHLTVLEQESQTAQATRPIVELDQRALGWLSRMDALQNQAMAKARQSRRDVQTRRLKLALKRMNEGTCGYRELCGESLPDGRLRIDPQAALCVSCSHG